ncbi:NADH-quinone oxidoreductase subunit J family protein [Planctomicrobium sp. SH661]|uniref:NADH-quinone oxidoreductase subunit J family protein n=1 Tax=Planctomicrobium sp. SH661 TaxID=3448124 RepID=UPI003F5BDF79
MEQFLFILYALFACGGAVAVVLSQNVVRMAFYLVVSLGSTAALFFLLGADFIGATQLLIYVGGTVVLLIFGVMLTASAPFSSIKNTPAEILQGGVVGLAFLMVVISTVLSVDWAKTQETLAHADSHAISETSGFNPAQEGNSSRRIGIALLGMRFDRDLQTGEHAAETSHVDGEHAHEHAEPQRFSTGYLLPFEIVSVHLLVVLVGASYLARSKRPHPATAA